MVTNAIAVKNLGVFMVLIFRLIIYFVFKSDTNLNTIFVTAKP